MTIYKQVEGEDRRKPSHFWATNAQLVGHQAGNEVRWPVQIIPGHNPDEELIVYYLKVGLQGTFRGEEINTLIQKHGFERMVIKPLFRGGEREVTFKWQPTLPPTSRK